MSLDRIASTFLETQLSNGQRFALPADDFISHLTLGQVLKGRVLRHIEGSHYAVEYAGKEKVVDSGVPLKTGELLYGRVVGLGDQIELERISTPKAEQPSLPEPSKNISINGFSNSAAELVVRLFTEFGAALSDRDALVLQRAMQANPKQEPAVYAGLLLAKLGLKFTVDRLEALTRALLLDPNQALFNERFAIYLASQATAPLNAVVQTESSISRDTRFMRMLSDITNGLAQTDAASTPHQGSDNSEYDGDAEARDQRGLGYALLNLQTDGNLRRRIATIPLVIDGQLIELNIGLVEQRDARQDQIGTKHRRLVFTLSTDALGILSVDGTLTGEHVQMRFSVENPDALDLLDSHVDFLRTALEQANFKVDAIRHDVRPWQEMSSAAWMITQSVICNDSLDRRI